MAGGVIDDAQVVILAGLTAAGAQTTNKSRMDSSGNLLVSQGTLPGSEVNPSSATNGWSRAYSQCNVTCCDGTGAVAIGAGGTNDTMILGIFIPATAGPPTATIAGFGKSTDGTSYTAKSLVITGSATLDTNVQFPGGLVNNVGAMTVTGSVDEVVWVFWRPL